MGKKNMSLAEAKRIQMDQYMEKRKREKKTDMYFPATNDEIKRRIISTTGELSRFTDYHLSEAAKAAEKGKKYFLVVDTEGYTIDRRYTSKNMPQTWSWHEQSLIAQNISAGELEKRLDMQELLRKSYSKLSAAQKAGQFWTRRREMRDIGVLPGNVMGISVAAVDDDKGRHAFAIHCQDLVKSDFDGKPQLPECFWDLLTHENVVVANVGAYEDIENIIRSFGLSRLPVPRVNYLEAGAFFGKAWDEIGDGERSVLSIVEEAFPDRTFFKSPMLMLSHWWNSPWQLNQAKYILNDVYFLAKAIACELRKGVDFDVGAMTYVFPQKQTVSIDWSFLHNGEPNQPDPVKKALEEEVPVPAHCRLPSHEVEADEDWEAELEAEIDETPLVIEEQSEEEVDEPEPQEVAVSEVETRPKAAASDASESKSEEDDVVPGPSGSTALAVRSTDCSGTVAIPHPRVQQYDVDVAENDEDIGIIPKRRRIIRETVYFQETTYTRFRPDLVGISEPSVAPVEPTVDRPVEPTADPIVLRRLSSAAKRAIPKHVRELKSHDIAKPVWENYTETNEEEMPELVAAVGTSRKLCSKQKKVVKQLVGEIAPQWSLEEKRRFLKAVGQNLRNLEFVHWAELVQLGEYDAVMFASTNYDSLISYIRSNNIDPNLVVQLAVPWLEGVQAQANSFQASRYFSPTLSARLADKVRVMEIGKRIVRICREFDIELPAPLRCRRLNHQVPIWLRAHASGRLSDMGLALLAFGAVQRDDGVKQRLFELASAKPQALELLRRVLSEGNNDVLNNVLPCWRSKDANHQREFELVEIESGEGKRKWREEIEKKPDHCFVSTRDTNNPLIADVIAFIIVSFPSSSTKFLFRCRPASDESFASLKYLFENIDIVSVVPPFASYRAFDISRRGALVAKKIIYRREAFCAIAARTKTRYCRATENDPTVDNDDLYDCQVYHLAAENELISKAAF